MADKANRNTEISLEEVADNPGAKAAAINSNPQISLEEARNAAAGEGPNAAGSPGASTVENHVPSTSDPDATDIPSANMPVPDESDPSDSDAAKRPDS